MESNTYYEIWQMDKYGNVLPQVENILMDENEEQGIKLPESYLYNSLYSN